MFEHEMFWLLAWFAVSLLMFPALVGFRSYRLTGSALVSGALTLGGLGTWAFLVWVFAAMLGMTAAPAWYWYVLPLLFAFGIAFGAILATDGADAEAAPGAGGN